MIDFLKARGESGHRLGPMNFMNLQALYFKVKKDEEERLGKKGSKKMDQRFEIFRGITERRRSIYRSVDEVLQLPDSDLDRILELGEAHEPANEGGKLLVLAIKHYFNPSKDVIIDIKPLKSHSPFASWSYNADFADLDEFTLTDVRKQKMICSSKTIYKMQHKDIKTLSALPLNNPSKDPRGYEVERIVSHMQKLQ
ncbi:hypothetical protein L1987_80692 [Smallanthus sonchifolius]|uniref:Uncharacterized protein n=1 Tax=Smallanthus sonchifolius TaxID=185202 RepID=A0ACB8YND6_9ASTR|nr:hypothetical protein L1987_80692 [Smallanthus sonchifolius]